MKKVSPKVWVMLGRAKKLLEQPGVWIKGEWSKCSVKTKICRHCIDGAIQTVYGSEREEHQDTTVGKVAREYASSALRTYVYSSLKLRARFSRYALNPDIVMFNDENITQKRDVLAVLDIAIKEARNAKAMD